MTNRQVACAGPQNTFLSALFAPPGDVGRAAQVSRAAQVNYDLNLKSVERFFYRKTMGELKCFT